MPVHSDHIQILGDDFDVKLRPNSFDDLLRGQIRKKILESYPLTILCVEFLAMVIEAVEIILISSHFDEIQIRRLFVFVLLYKKRCSFLARFSKEFGLNENVSL